MKLTDYNIYLKLKYCDGFLAEIIDGETEINPNSKSYKPAVYLLNRFGICSDSHPYRTEEIESV